jgi:hypothetical protein
MGFIVGSHQEAGQRKPFLGPKEPSNACFRISYFTKGIVCVLRTNQLEGEDAHGLGIWVKCEIWN